MPECCSFILSDFAFHQIPFITVSLQEVHLVGVQSVSPTPSKRTNTRRIVDIPTSQCVRFERGSSPRIHGLSGEAQCLGRRACLRNTSVQCWKRPWCCTVSTGRRLGHSALGIASCAGPVAGWRETVRILGRYLCRVRGLKECSPRVP